MTKIKKLIFVYQYLADQYLFASMYKDSTRCVDNVLCPANFADDHP